MKKFLVSVIVPSAAAIALVGSGFSVWYFGNNQVESTNTLSVEVKNLLKIGSLSGGSDGKLVFDQTSDGRKAAMNNVTDDLSSIEATGLTFALNNEGNKTISYTSPTDGVDNGTFGADEVRVEIKTKITLNEALAKYVTVDTTEESMEGTGTTFTYTWSNQSLDLSTFVTFKYATYTNQYDSVTGHATRTTFTSAEPLNEEEYKAMKTEVSGITGNAITFETTATLVK